MPSTVAFTPQPRQPIDELIGFLKQGDNYNQDTRNWPDPTEPRASKPPEAAGCTCQQGNKLDCPIHGMHADPALVELDHTWSMPQAQPIGYQQDGPRNWTQAVSSVTSRAESPEAYAPDTNNQAIHQADRQTQLGSDNQLPDGKRPGRFQARDRLQRRRSGLFGREVRDVPKLDSFLVTNHQSQSVKCNGDFIDMEDDLVPFGTVKRGSPVRECIKDHSQSFGYVGVNRSRFSGHDSTVVVGPKHPSQIWQQITNADHYASDPQSKAERIDTGQVEHQADATSDISDPERHKWSVTRVAGKSIKLRVFKPGKWGKGIISEDGKTILTWRIKGGWNGSPHHEDVYDVLRLEPSGDVAFHIAQDCKFYFHEDDREFDAPRDPAKLARCVEKEFPALQWGKISVEEYDRITESSG